MPLNIASHCMHICTEHINSIQILVVYASNVRSFVSFSLFMRTSTARLTRLDASATDHCWSLASQSWPQLTFLFAIELVIRYMQGRKAVHYNEVIMHSGALMFAFIFRYTLASY